MNAYVAEVMVKIGTPIVCRTCGYTVAYVDAKYLENFNKLSDEEKSKLASSSKGNVFVWGLCD
jgi:hypothetical protein